MIRLTPEQFDAHQARVKGKLAVDEPAKRNKFGAVKTHADGIEFDSKHDALEVVAIPSMAWKGNR